MTSFGGNQKSKFLVYLQKWQFITENWIDWWFFILILKKFWNIWNRKDYILNNVFNEKNSEVCLKLHYLYSHSLLALQFCALYFRLGIFSSFNLISAQCPLSWTSSCLQFNSWVCFHIIYSVNELSKKWTNYFGLLSWCTYLYIFLWNLENLLDYYLGFQNFAKA